MNSLGNDTPTPPAGAEDDWPNTSGRVVDAAGNALPSSLAGAEPSPEEAAARAVEELHEYFERIRDDVLSVPDSDVSEAIITRHFAPLRAELERVKGDLTAQIEATRQVKASFDWMQQEHDKETDISCGLRVELAAVKEALQQATARIAELKGHHQRDEAIIVQRTDEVRLLTSDLTTARARITELDDLRQQQLQALGFAEDDTTVIADEIRRIRDEGREHFHSVTKLSARIGELEKAAEQDRSFREWCYVTVGTDNLERLKTLLENGSKMA